MSIVCSHVKSTHKELLNKGGKCKLFLTEMANSKVVPENINNKLLKKQFEIKLLTLLKMAFEKENFGDDKTKETVFNILNNEIV